MSDPPDDVPDPITDPALLHSGGPLPDSSRTATLDPALMPRLWPTPPDLPPPLHLAPPPTPVPLTPTTVLPESARTLVLQSDDEERSTLRPDLRRAAFMAPSFDFVDDDLDDAPTADTSDAEPEPRAVRPLGRLGGAWVLAFGDAEPPTPAREVTPTEVDKLEAWLTGRPPAPIVLAPSARALERWLRVR